MPISTMGSQEMRYRLKYKVISSFVVNPRYNPFAPSNLGTAIALLAEVIVSCCRILGVTETSCRGLEDEFKLLVMIWTGGESDPFSNEKS